MKIILDELKEGDQRIILDSIEIIYQKKDKLYFHNAIIDFSKEAENEGFIVIPAFNGF